MLRYGSETRAIDVACGPGTTTLLLAPAVRHVTAVDFSAAMLDRASPQRRCRQAANVEIVEADGQALPFADDSFDLGVSMFGLMFFRIAARDLPSCTAFSAPAGRRWCRAGRRPSSRH